MLRTSEPRIISSKHDPLPEGAVGLYVPVRGIDEASQQTMKILQVSVGEQFSEANLSFTRSEFRYYGRRAVWQSFFGCLMSNPRLSYPEMALEYNQVVYDQAEKINTECPSIEFGIKSVAPKYMERSGKTLFLASIGGANFSEVVDANVDGFTGAIMEKSQAAPRITDMYNFSDDPCIVVASTAYGEVVSDLNEVIETELVDKPLALGKIALKTQLEYQSREARLAHQRQM